MSQHDMDISSTPNGATVAADISAALVALAGLSSGGTAPTTTFAYQLWADTGTGLLKQRNSANTGWNAIAKAVFPMISMRTWRATAGWASPCRRRMAARASALPKRR